MSTPEFALSLSKKTKQIQLTNTVAQIQWTTLILAMKAAFK